MGMPWYAKQPTQASQHDSFRLTTGHSYLQTQLLKTGTNRAMLFTVRWINSIFTYVQPSQTPVTG